MVKKDSSDKFSDFEHDEKEKIPYEVDEKLISELHGALENGFLDLGIKKGSAPSPVAYRDVAGQLDMDWRPLKDFYTNPSIDTHPRTIKNLIEGLRGVNVDQLKSFIELSNIFTSSDFDRLVFQHYEDPNMPTEPHQKGILKTLGDLRVLSSMAASLKEKIGIEDTLKYKIEVQNFSQVVFLEIKERGSFLMAAKIPFYNQPPDDIHVDGPISAHLVILVSGLESSDHPKAKANVAWTNII